MPATTPAAGVPGVAPQAGVPGVAPASGNRPVTDTGTAEVKPASVTATKANPGTGAAAPPKGAGAATPAKVANAPAAANGLKPFADVVADAEALPGLITLWRKSEKVWIELRPEQLGEPFFLSINLSRGIGEHRLHAGAMGASYTAGDSFVAEFRRIGGLIQLIARNTRFTARAGSPEEKAVRSGFSDSLLASAQVVSQPHPERGSILVEANALLLADIPRGAHAIERAYRNVFAFDARNSHFASVRSDPALTAFDVEAHYAQARIPVPPVAAGARYFPPPSVIQDPRSLFLGFLYSFARLPDEPMRPRPADPRIGHFSTVRVDFSDERKVTPYRHYLNRWRLEKKDPEAERSDPVKPIVFWLDRAIPERYREPITAGILEWNKAFEHAGFRNAIEVRVQPDDADFDTGDALHASVRWMTTATPSYGAIGPRHVDPRTGEILDADIGIDAGITRSMRFFRREAVREAWQPMYDDAGQPQGETLGIDAGTAQLCGYAEHAAHELGFALAMLESRGDIDPEGPEAERFVAEYLKDVLMHETGHALGLAHNFRGSTAYTAAQLADPQFVAAHGIGGSVMDYHPVNLAARGEKQGPFRMPSLGAYDYWAIEYAYKPIAPGDESEALAEIAGRSGEPQLAYGSDYEAYEGVDPEVNLLDLGGDSLAYYRKRIDLSRELWERLEKRALRPGESYGMLRRQFMSGFSQMGLAMGLAAKYVGGFTVVRDHAGTDRTPVTPVPSTRQREALTLIADSLFRAESFRVPPDFLRRLVRDPLERETTWPPGAGVVALPEMVIGVQRDVLNRLMSAGVAQRLLAGEMQVGDVREAMTLGELYDTLQRTIWSEAAAATDVDLLRRNLQREHLRRLTGALLAPTAGFPADARALHRVQAQRLQQQLANAVRAPRLGLETRAHYSEALETLEGALEASLLRSGV